ncbi:MAG: prephenate dehydratase [Candidatus Desulforudis sp.]|nr:prephenate dehydratase [Desulforudis sp.]
MDVKVEIIAYLGPEGTYSEEAAAVWAAGRAVTLSPLGSLVEVAGAVDGGRVDWGLLPTENSCEGSLALTLDLLIHQAERLQICGEVVLPIRHHLLARPGTEKNRVIRIISHFQALAQCRGYLEEHFPRVELGESGSTAEAARTVSGSNEPWAAIGTVKAARLHGLEVLSEGIGDLRENATRFLVIGRRNCSIGTGDKTTVLVGVDNRPGALYRLLGEFARRGVNLTRIESRPAKTRLGEYVFFIDFEGHPRMPEVAEALAGARQRGTFLKILGSYPAVGVPTTARDNTPPGLEQIRDEIDVLDGWIVDLLAERVSLVRSIGRLKNGRPVRDPAREHRIIGRLQELAAQKGVDPELVSGVYGVLFPYFVDLQASRDS